MLTNFTVCHEVLLVFLVTCLVVHLVIKEHLSVSSVIVPDLLQCHPGSWCMVLCFCNNAVQFHRALRVPVDHPSELYKLIVLVIIQGNLHLKDEKCITVNQGIS